MPELKEEHFEIHDRNKANRHERMRVSLILLEKIKDICQDHLSNTDINDVALCEDSHDHYLLGKWDLANEIMEEILKKENKNAKV